MTIEDHPRENFEGTKNNFTCFLGEEYFMGGDGDCLVYFSALWLTGQVERAIDLLFRLETPVHAAHISIIAYQFRMLVLSETVSAPICKFLLQFILLKYRGLSAKNDPLLCFCPKKFQKNFPQ